MSHARELPHRPTYADIEALPSNVVGEILGGELFVSPRPAGRMALLAISSNRAAIGAFSTGG